MCWAAICFLNKLDINVMRYCHPARGASTLWPILEAKNQQFLSHFVLTVQDGGRHAKLVFPNGTIVSTMNGATMEANEEEHEEEDGRSYEIIPFMSDRRANSGRKLFCQVDGSTRSHDI